MKKINNKLIANVGIFAAIGVVFDLIASLIGVDPWQQGGSISIAMVPIFIIAYYYGAIAGISCGLIVGVVQLAWGSSIGVLGVMLDYILPYSCIGFAGTFIKRDSNVKGKYIWFILSMFVVGIIRLFFHTLSGVVIYEYTWLASFLYNMPYVLTSLAISVVLTCILINRLDFIFKDKINN